ncbi:prolyl-tRNA synthetase associated domain-containing protein [Limosilactobacillus ingluviei]
MMLDKQAIYQLLQQRGYWHEITEHAAVFDMASLADLNLLYPDQDAKNLFVRDDKHRHYYLLTVKGEKRVDLKAFARAQGLRRLSFASAADLQRLLGVQPGAVTPLGLLNAPGGTVDYYLDVELTEPPAFLGVHPNDNTATVWLKSQDLLAWLTDHGVKCQVVTMPS